MTLWMALPFQEWKRMHTFAWITARIECRRFFCYVNGFREIGQRIELIPTVHRMEVSVVGKGHRNFAGPILMLLQPLECFIVFQIHFVLQKLQERIGITDNTDQFAVIFIKMLISNKPDQSINQSIDQWMSQWINQSINQWVSGWINQSINQSID